MNENISPQEEFAIQMVCALIHSERVEKEKKGWEPDIMVYNSSPNFGIRGNIGGTDFHRTAVMLQTGFFRLVWLSACFILTDAYESPVIKPSRLVVEYGAKASANCSTADSPSGMGWEASQGQINQVVGVQFLMWTVQNLTQWDIAPMCFVNWEVRKQTMKELQVTVYKRPDVMSMNNCSMPVMEGETCLLQCDVQNVAPVQYLEVTWYKEQFPIRHISFNESITTPVNKSINVLVQLSRDDDGAQYWCEAKLELGPEGPQPPPAIKSHPFSIAVHYKPMFSNDTEILEAGEEEFILDCSASANPPSMYIWKGRSLEREVMSSSLPVSYPGNYTCTALNLYGKAQKLFIIKPKYHDYTTFWSLLGAGLALAPGLCIGYIIIKKIRVSSPQQGQSPSPSAQKEESVSFNC